MGIEEVRRRVYPEVHAGGFSDNDSSILFYSRINALVDEDAIVLDYGAGRGVAQQTDPCLYRRRLRTLKGRVKKIVGCDVDPVVLENPVLDEAHVVAIGERLPFDDRVFNLILSDFVFEHIAEPDSVARELSRVLRPGGWIVARTPNKFGYSAVATMLTPPRFRRAVLRLTNPSSGGQDNFPVTLKMNTLRSIRQIFPDSGFENYSYFRRFEGMGYFGRSELLLRLVRVLMHFVPTRFGPELIVVLRKREIRLGPVDAT